MQYTWTYKIFYSMVNTLKMELGHRLISYNLIYYKSEK